MKYVNVLVLLVLTFVVATQSSASEQAQVRDLYANKCGRCHRAYEPQEYSAGQWQSWMQTMRGKAGLTTNQYEQLTTYLVAEGGGTSTEPAATGPQVGGYLYTEYFQSQEETSNFDLHYLAIKLSGAANERITYFAEFELEHGGKGDNTFVEQAYLDYWLVPQVAAKIGAMLTPFGRFDENHDPLSNHLITRPQVAREIGVSAWKEVGVDVHGFANLGTDNVLLFDVYTINGLGAGSNLRGSRQYRDNNEDLAFGGRLSLVHADVVEFGGSVYNGAWDDDGNHDVTSVGAHLLVTTQPVDIFAEYRDASSENPGALADGEMSGYFVQASRLFAEKFRPAVRYGALDYLDPGDALGRDPAKGDKDLTELALGFAYYPTPKVAFKIEYTFFGEGDRKPETDNNVLGLQAAVDF